ncbi:hypothetical protein B0T25DRAFT_597289 [Lasiosphaeria hispida]|uniref:Uncharacterized protein n=1 Tax=Lasiosphaeria hispida TaxID=260671 RepID=A0AAJ0HW76_9PEZI|nr:hypothetical protein B0T25DRAFT_597289 [Lasiosphaeria hispida]
MAAAHHNRTRSKQAPDWEARVADLTKTYLDCSACDAEHPACLFSAQQRNRPWAKSKRICIGHQGHIRLCEHVTLPWSSVVAEAERRLLPDARLPKEGDSTLAKCERSVHTRSGGPRRSFSEWFCGDLTRKAAQSSRHMTCCPFMPTVTCTFRESAAAPPLGVLVVKLAWSGHLTLAMGSDGCFASEDLERGLRRLYREQGHFICPQLSPGPITGSRLCGPDRCDCVWYEGCTETGWLRPPVEWRKKTTCRHDRTLGLGIKNDDKHRLRRDVPNGIKCQCYSQCSTGQQCSSARPFNGCYDIQVADIIGCDKDTDCAVVSYSARVIIELHRSQQHLGQMSANWYHALDPGSYNLTRDKEGFGVYWCRDEGCRNYYRFTRSRLRGVLKASEYLRI